MVSLRFFKPLVLNHIKNLFRGSTKKFLKCTKIINLRNSGCLFYGFWPWSPKYLYCFIDTRPHSKVNNKDLSFYIEIFFNRFLLHYFPIKYCSKACRKFLGSFNKKELELLGRQAQNKILQSKDFQRRLLHP